MHRPVHHIKLSSRSARGHHATSARACTNGLGKSLTFLLWGNAEVFVEHRVPRYATHLKTPEVIRANRASASGVALTQASQVPSGGMQATLARGKMDLKNAMHLVAKDMARLFKRPSSGRLEDVLPLRARFGEWLSTQSSQQKSLWESAQRDAFLLLQLCEKYDYGDDVRVRLTDELASIRLKDL